MKNYNSIHLVTDEDPEEHVNSPQEMQKKKIRAKYKNLKVKKYKRRAIRDQALLRQMIDQINAVSADAYGKLDFMDRQALLNWKTNFQHLEKINHLAKTIENKTYSAVNGAKIIGMYKIYGNENSTLVNPAENPFKLEVRDRDFER